ncbi:transport and Golgi organization protein 2 [Gillisia mitskevichiae]|uniref:Transport and Golgi organization protein 2 n=1 Tax=Gillisia mitskevichiae TaxID=270921 RepID=A0A495P031_9FLAO|nr:NRDE family protein [Gillisia mitskevichiae]RKS43446.1 transport and Golgi organization protein 2 [Gillisia mitskevichiae]
MCTVTLIPFPVKKTGFILTSNRDEAADRKALSPDFYLENGVKMLYPKDKLAGGTWIGLSERKRLICLLNGEFKPHVRETNYRLSRGVVVKDLLATISIDEAVENYDLVNIEPFTIIAVDWNSHLRFLELVWDGKIKHFQELELKPHIWSSSPLYSSEMKKQRETWFQEFQQKNIADANSLWNFHFSAGVGDPNVDVVMNRGYVKTQNITQIESSHDLTEMRFMDLKDRDKIELKF